MVKAETCIDGEIFKNREGILQVPGGLTAHRTFAKYKGIRLIERQDELVQFRFLRFIFIRNVKGEEFSGCHPLPFNSNLDQMSVFQVGQIDKESLPDMLPKLTGRQRSSAGPGMSSD